ncbi:hypothetical protein F5Y17DRAFT_453148 [Xylariaceae sp. FL0594]|nr:hypothetical protein F5Y17DRAFT_453148 [Xylariaceae sp. FL0594]
MSLAYLPSTVPAFDVPMFEVTRIDSFALYHDVETSHIKTFTPDGEFSPAWEPIIPHNEVSHIRLEELETRLLTKLFAYKNLDPDTPLILVIDYLRNEHHRLFQVCPSAFEVFAGWIDPSDTTMNTIYGEQTLFKLASKDPWAFSLPASPKFHPTDLAVAQLATLFSLANPRQPAVEVAALREDLLGGHDTGPAQLDKARSSGSASRGGSAPSVTSAMTATSGLSWWGRSLLLRLNAHSPLSTIPLLAPTTIAFCRACSGR